MCVILLSYVLLIKLSRGWVIWMFLNQKLSQAAKNNCNVSYKNYIEMGEFFVVFFCEISIYTNLIRFFSICVFFFLHFAIVYDICAGLSSMCKISINVFLNEHVANVFHLKFINTDTHAHIYIRYVYIYLEFLSILNFGQQYVFLSSSRTRLNVNKTQWNICWICFFRTGFRIRTKE